MPSSPSSSSPSSSGTGSSQAVLEAGAVEFQRSQAEALQSAREFLEQQRYEKAREHASALLESHPENQQAALVLTYALFGSGKRAVQEGKFESAMDLFDEMMRDYPGSLVPKQRIERALAYKAMLQYALAKRQVSRSNWGQARDLFQQAIESQRLPPELAPKARRFMRGCAKQRRQLKRKARLDGRTVQPCVGEESTRGFSLYIGAKRHLNNLPPFHPCS